MTAPRSQRFFTTRRSTHSRLTSIFCALILSLIPLAAQPLSARSPVDRSSTPAEHQQSPVGNHGPVLSSFENAQGAILLHFTQAEGGPLLKGSGRDTFEIAGPDHTWFPADAHIVNGVVVVSTSLVPQPIAVRYTPSSPAAATLFNSAGVPAAPFRTDK